MVGFVLALPLAAVALWRAGKASWWAPVSVVAGYRRLHAVQRDLVGLR